MNWTLLLQSSSLEEEAEPEYHQLFEYVFVVGLREGEGVCGCGREGVCGCGCRCVCVCGRGSNGVGKVCPSGLDLQES